MENAVITDVKYIFDDTETQISAVFDGVEMTVPKWPGNSHYDEIKARVDAGTLTIAAYE